MMPHEARAGTFYPGVNEAGLEFGVDGRSFSGSLDSGYAVPSASAIKTLATKFSSAGDGSCIMRLPHSWERLQRTLGGALDQKYLGLIQTAVQNINNAGCVALLDVHNYARWNGKLIGPDIPASHLADLWTRLATTFKSKNVWFGIMNEPHDMDSTTWFKAAQGAINAIRATGATNTITVPGNCWTSAAGWTGSCKGDTSNADMALKYIKDSNVVYEMHQYFDSDYSGTHSACTHTDPASMLAPTTKWLKANGARALLGEFGGSSDPSCLDVLKKLTGYLVENSDQWIGFAYWAAGSGWGDYIALGGNSAAAAPASPSASNPTKTTHAAPAPAPSSAHGSAPITISTNIVFAGTPAAAPTPTAAKPALAATPIVAADPAANPLPAALLAALQAALAALPGLNPLAVPPPPALVAAPPVQVVQPQPQPPVVVVVMDPASLGGLMGGGGNDGAASMQGMSALDGQEGVGPVMVEGARRRRGSRRSD
ncbi:hypothetical protein HK101_007878 [Irineochytrium annulatum]|nr:hypothetical protein HK101_007878 [Irineochytrium annulatum]